MARKKRDEAEIEAVREELPLNPPPAVLETIKNRHKAAKLVYRCGYYRDLITGLKHKAALVQCTACGEKYYLSHTYAGSGCHAGGYGDSFGFIDPFDNEAKCTGSTCICPECGATAEALHISHIRETYDFEETYFMTVHNIRGHFVSLSWVLFKSCDKDANISYTIQRYEGIALIGGLPIRYTGYVKGYFGYWSDKWNTRAVWKDNGDEWDIEEIFMNRQDFDSSDASKSGLEKYIIDERKKIRVGAYLQLWTSYPQIENLVRSGCSPFVRRLIEKATMQSGYYSTTRNFSIKEAEQHFNKKKVKPHEMLGLEKAELPLANKWTIERLEFYKQVLNTAKIRLTEKQLEVAESFGAARFENLFEYAKNEFGFDAPFIRTLNYLSKQQAAHGSVIDIQYIRDYWSMTKKIQGCLPSELIFPKDLQRAHDLAVLQQKVKTNLEINQKIEAFAATLDWLSFTDNETGLFIRAARNQEELIKEGRFLSHCVGTYAQSVSERKTCILFIRKIDDPEIPFYTLEYKDGEVIQNRGRHNCERTQEVKLFESKWLEYIKNYKELIKKNGKRSSRKQERIRAGA